MFPGAPLWLPTGLARGRTSQGAKERPGAKRQRREKAIIRLAAAQQKEAVKLKHIQ